SSHNRCLRFFYTRPSSFQQGIEIQGSKGKCREVPSLRRPRRNLVTKVLLHKCVQAHVTETSRLQRGSCLGWDDRRGLISPDSAPSQNYASEQIENWFSNRVHKHTPKNQESIGRL